MAKASDHRPWAATRKGLANQLAQIDGILPGSVVVRHMPCGKPGCACKADPPELHGPYIQCVARHALWGWWRHVW